MGEEGGDNGRRGYTILMYPPHFVISYMLFTFCGWSYEWVHWSFCYQAAC